MSPPVVLVLVVVCVLSLKVLCLFYMPLSVTYTCGCDLNLNVLPHPSGSGKLHCHLLFLLWQKVMYQPVHPYCVYLCILKCSLLHLSSSLLENCCLDKWAISLCLIGHDLWKLCNIIIHQKYRTAPSPSLFQPVAPVLQPSPLIYIPATGVTGHIRACIVQQSGECSGYHCEISSISGFLAV